MKRPSLFPIERLEHYLRLVGIATAVTLVAFFLFTLTTPLEPERRSSLLIFTFIAALYTFLHFRYLLPRFIGHQWFHFLQATVGALLIFAAGLLLDIFLPAFDMLIALYVVVTALMAGRAVSVYAALLGSLVTLILEEYHLVVYYGMAAVWLAFLLRIVVYSTLALLVWAVMDKAIRQGQEAAEAAERQSREAARQLRELQALQQLATAVGSSLDLQTVLQLAIAQTIEAVKMDAGLVRLLNEETHELHMVAHQGLPDTAAQQIRTHPLPVGQGLPGLAVTERRPLVSEDITQDPRVIGPYLRGAGFKSQISIPLMAGSHLVGVMSVVKYTTHKPDVNELTFLSAIGEQVGQAVQRARSYTAEQSRRQLAESFSRIAQAVSEGLELDATLNIILGELQQLVPYQSAALMLNRRGQLQVQAARGYPAGLDLSRIRFDVNRNALLTPIMRDGQAIVVPNTHADNRWEMLPGLEYIHCWAGAPLVSQGAVMGILGIDRSEPFSISQEAVQLLSAFANESALAIEKAQLLQQAQRRLEQLGALNQVGQAIGSALELSQVLQAVHEQVVRVTGNRDFYIALYDDRNDEVTFAYDYQQGQLRQGRRRRGGNGLTEYVIRTRMPLLLQSDIARFAEEHGIQRRGRPACSWLGVPLSKGDKVIGVMAVQNYEREHAYDDEDVELFKTLAGQVAIAIGNARLYESTRRNLKEAATLYEFTKKVGRPADRQLFALSAALACREVIKSHTIVVYLYEDDPPKLTPQVAIENNRIISPEQEAQRIQELSERVLDGVVGWVMRHGQGARLNDASTDTRYRGSPEVCSALCLPIMLQAHTLGAINLESLELNAYDERDERFVATLAGQLAIALESARLKEIEVQRTFELSGLHEISQAFAAMGEPRATYAEVTRRLAQIFNTRGAVILLYDRQQNELRAQVPAYGQPDELIQDLRYPLNDDALALWNPHVEPSWVVNDLSILPEYFQQFARQFKLRRIMGAAMYGREGLIGVLYVANRPTRVPFTPREGELLAVFARQAALAIENARLVEDERMNREQLMILNQIGQRAAATLELSPLLHELVEFIRHRLRAHTVALFFVEGQDLTLRSVAGGFAEFGMHGYRQPISVGVLGWVVRHRAPRLVKNIQDDAEFIDPMGMGMQSEVAVPLLSRDEVIGVLDVAGDLPNQFGESDVVLLSTIADQVSQAIVNARLYERERRRANQLATISRLGREIASLLNLPELLQHTVTLIQESFGYRDVNIFLVDRPQEIARFAAGSRTDDSDHESGPLPIRMGSEGLIGKAIAERRAILENDVQQNADNVEQPSPTVIQSELVVPIQRGDQVLGALDVQSDQRDAFTEDDVFVMQTLADQLGVAMANAELHMAVEHQARTDSLTQVYNHGYFLEKLREYIELSQQSNNHLSLIMLDIDHFKQYNDRYGHVTGDNVLRAIVQVIRQNIKHDDIVGRWGGEEFGVALPNTDAQQALIVAERIRKTLAKFPLTDHAGQPIEKPTVSQGVATFPQHAASFDELVDLADKMLYQAKAKGRDQIVLYEIGDWRQRSGPLVGLEIGD